MTGSIFSRPARRPPGDPRLRARDEKLEALKAVTGKLAHDFNNFLVPQFGYLTLLKEDLPPQSTSAEYTARMEAAGRKTESYIESILLGMRPHRQFSPTEFSFSGLLESTIQQWKAAIPPETAVEIETAIAPCALVGDERHWKAVLQHLLSNARYALATGGRLAVALKRCSLDGETIARLGLDTDDVFQLTVKDSGFGMAPEVVTRAFEPFFTTRTQIKAPGLGLTIVHAVTQFHGGQVDLESEEDQGTTVTLWIPPNGVAGRERPVSLGAAGGGAKSKRKVLLMEDDPIISEVLRDWLGRFDFEVQVASNVEDAVKVFERKRTEWSLAIIETDFRATRGEELFEKLSGANPELSWIFLAGRRKPVFASELAAAGTTPLVIQKPVTLRAFVDVVRKQSATQ